MPFGDVYIGKKKRQILWIEARSLAKDANGDMNNMNARESHLLKEQTKRDTQQKKADAIPPLVLFGVVRRSHKNSHKGYQKYEIEADIRQAELCDHAVRITLKDMGKVKKRRSKRQLFCSLHWTTCTPDDEGYAECGDLVKECHWLSHNPRFEKRGMTLLRAHRDNVIYV